MSEAYIIREKFIWVNEDRGFFQYDNNGENLTMYVHEDEEYCFDIENQRELLDELLSFGAEPYTNKDFIGDIEISKEDFESMLENSTINFDKCDLESIELIKNYFEEGYNWLILRCDN